MGTGPTDLTTELVTDLDRVDAGVLAAWDALAVGCALPYATPAWMLAFWREVHGPSGQAEPRVVVVRDGADVVGLGPFFAGAPRRFGRREWWPLGVGIGQRVGPLARAGREREVAAALARAVAAGRPTTVRLPAGDAAVPWGRWLAGAWPARPRPRDLVERVEPAPVVTLRPDGDHAAWFAGRSRNLRSEVGRRTRLVARRGGWIRRIEEPADVAPAVATLFALQRDRFAALGRASLIPPPVERAVAAGATALLRAGGRARIWVVETDDGIVGGDVHLVAGPRMCCFNGGISPAWARESLGTLLLEAAVRDGHGLGLATLDLGGGDQWFKQRFADGDAPLTWRAVIPRGTRYPLERGRLLPADARHLARRVAARLPERHRARLRERMGALRRRA